MLSKNRTRPQAVSVISCALSSHIGQAGGASRDRTDDPLLAKQVLSQLSYGPVMSFIEESGGSRRTRTSDLTLIRGAL